MLDPNLLKAGWHCKCPKCLNGDLYQSKLSFQIKEQCEACNLDLAENDSADGPAVFLIFILGSIIVPIALWIAMITDWPLWVHTILWSAVTLASTLGALRPVKAYVIALQYKYTPWGDSPKNPD